MNDFGPSRSAEEFGRPIGNHFISIHVGGGPRTGLENVHGKLLVEPTLNNFLSGGADTLRQLGVQKPEVLVDLRRGSLDQPQSTQHGPGEAQSADREVLDRPRRLDPVIGSGRHLEFAHRIPLSARGLVRATGGRPCRLFRIVQIHDHLTTGQRRASRKGAIVIQIRRGIQA